MLFCKRSVWRIIMNNCFQTLLFSFFKKIKIPWHFSNNSKTKKIRECNVDIKLIIVSMKGHTNRSKFCLVALVKRKNTWTKYPTKNPYLRIAQEQSSKTWIFLEVFQQQKISRIKRLILIKIAPLTKLLCNCPLFFNYPLPDL